MKNSKESYRELLLRVAALEGTYLAQCKHIEDLKSQNATLVRIINDLVSRYGQD